jgi:glycosyltransferase involved in cell wall biosynthesis
MKLLFVLKNFFQGWGGAPESVRLMSRRLALRGVVSDVVDAGRFHPDIADLDVLPLRGAPADAFDPMRTAEYDAVLLVGPWQPFLPTWRILRRMREGQPLLYLPRGGLAAIEFEGRRALKKLPYWPLIERRLVDRASGVVFSSEAERRTSARLSDHPAPQHVIPDYFEALPATGERPDADATIVFATLAELSPRKGVLELVDAFVHWVEARGLRDSVRLCVGGAPRPGSEAYVAETRARAEAGDADVRFIGAVAHGDRARFYASCDVFAATSRFESFCLTALEAAAAGCGLLTGPELGVLEYLDEGPGLIISSSLARTTLIEALDRALANARAISRDERSRRALARIDAINALADERWSRVLRRGLQLQNEPGVDASS